MPRRADGDDASIPLRRSWRAGFAGLRGGALKAQTTKPHDNTTQHTCMSGPGRVRGGRERGIVTPCTMCHVCTRAICVYQPVRVPVCVTEHTGVCAEQEQINTTVQMLTPQLVAAGCHKVRLDSGLLSSTSIHGASERRATLP